MICALKGGDGKRGMNRIFKHRLHLGLALCACGALGCTKEYNPFADRSLARASVTECSFVCGDTVEIFCRETLSVAIAVKELVDSILLEVEGNRLFAERMKVVAAESPGSQYQFVVSFFDTGWQRIGLRTFREGGEEVSEACSVFTRSPVAQDAVEGVFDSTVELSASSVVDDDVLYHWDFGYGQPVTSPFAHTIATIHDAAFSQQGQVWVTDVSGTYASPKTPFAYSFNDTKGPSIVCVNEGYEGRDTVMSGAETFFFKVHITDRGRGGVYSTSIDGGSFDLVQDPLYVKIFYNVNSLTSYRTISVSAVDNAQDGNQTIKSFYLGYDSTLAEGGGARILIIIPASDSTVSRARQRYLYGLVENYTGDSLLLGVDVNDSAYARDTLSDGFSASWGKSVYFDGSTNAVRVRAYTLGGTVVDDTAFTVFFDSTMQDTVAPRIFEVSIDGKAAGGLYVEHDTVNVRIIAFDEGSGVASLTVNGAPHAPSGSFGGYVWDVPIVLSHGAAGTPLVVVATDGQGLVQDTTVTVFQNSAPVLQVGASPPYPLVAGEIYRDTLIADDAEGDTVRFEKTSGPTDFQVSLNGELEWKPTKSDVGTYTIGVIIKDNITATPYQFYATVVDSSFYGSEVQFTVTEQNFPTYVEAGKDTVRVTLSITAGSGTGPFAYEAVRRVGTSQENIPITGGVFEWVPTASDTGYQRFVVTVRDKYERADTLYPIVLVVPPNRQCSLSYTFGGDTLPDGSLDLTQSTQPESLYFSIEDPDRVEIERYVVTISHAGTEDIRTIEGADSFVVVIDPAEAPGATGTLSVTVRDKGGHTATETIQLKFSP